MRISKCRICGYQGKVSYQRLCAKCSADRQRELVQQLQTRSGAYYERWKLGYDAAVRNGVIGRPKGGK